METPIKDLLVQSRFKNNILFEAMAGRSVVEIAEQSGVHLHSIYPLLSLKASPFSSVGDGKTYREPCKQLAAFFRMLPEDLFPASLYALNLPNIVEREYSSETVLKQLSCREAMMLPAPDGFKTVEVEERAAMIKAVLQTLSPREEKVLTMRFGLGEGGSSDPDEASVSLEEVAEVFSVSKERVRQIEAKALRKLRHPSRSRNLRVFLEGASKEYL